jgi:hypothetical protein
MAYGQSWAENTPAGTSDANTLDTIIQNLKVALTERFRLGGMYFPTTHDEAAGQYDFILGRVQGSKPTVAADQGAFYIKDVSAKGEAHYEDEDGDEIQLTTGGRLRAPNVGARVYRTTTQSIPNGGNHAISFDAERYDNGGLWVIGSPTRLTIPADGGGVYAIGGNIDWAPASGYAILQIKLNNTDVIASVYFTPGGGQHLQIHTVYELVATDYLEFTVQQVSGVAVNLGSTAKYSPDFWAQLIGG